MRDLAALTAAMHERGLRVTPQRQVIHALLAEGPNHVTVDAVHEAVVAVLPTVSLRTVYQALHDLDELGEIRLVPLGGGAYRVDTRTDAHAHLMCARCGDVRDVDLEPGAILPARSQRHGFTVEATDVVFSGVCPRCRAEERPATS